MRISSNMMTHFLDEGVCSSWNDIDMKMKEKIKQPKIKSLLKRVQSSPKTYQSSKKRKQNDNASLVDQSKKKSHSFQFHFENNVQDSELEQIIIRKSSFCSFKARKSQSCKDHSQTIQLSLRKGKKEHKREIKNSKKEKNCKENDLLKNLSITSFITQKGCVELSDTVRLESPKLKVSSHPSPVKFTRPFSHLNTLSSIRRGKTKSFSLTEYRRENSYDPSMKDSCQQDLVTARLRPKVDRMNKDPQGNIFKEKFLIENKKKYHEENSLLGKLLSINKIQMPRGREARLNSAHLNCQKRRNQRSKQNCPSTFTSSDTFQKYNSRKFVELINSSKMNEKVKHRLKL